MTPWKEGKVKRSLTKKSLEFLYLQGIRRRKDFEKRNEKDAWELIPIRPYIG
jgi:hypothetical protein